MNQPHPLILASSSVYRKELLERLHIPFTTLSPDLDETPLPKESPTELVKRLSLAKAARVGDQNPSAWVIGSDQVADFAGTAIGKPGNFSNALAQLQSMRGHTVIFRTGLCLYQQQTNTVLYDCVHTAVTFRELDDQFLQNYLLTEKPYDCAGSAKSEGLGISLLSAVESVDPTALIGLPLIRLTSFLLSVGFKIPSHSHTPLNRTFSQ